MKPCMRYDRERPCLTDYVHLLDGDGLPLAELRRQVSQDYAATQIRNGEDESNHAALNTVLRMLDTKTDSHGGRC